jgi:hypothetical protein
MRMGDYYLFITIMIIYSTYYKNGDRINLLKKVGGETETINYSSIAKLNFSALL